LLSAPETAYSLDELAAALSVYEELRVICPTLTSVDVAVAALVPFDPDVLLVCVQRALETDNTPIGVLDALEAVGLRDRWVPMLVGPAVTRGHAHRLGYDDGFAPTPIGVLAVALARAGVANEEYRRHGSSPPCYLE
jgi:hypothetical protein